jgi:hypothetical protein
MRDTSAPNYNVATGKAQVAPGRSPNSEVIRPYTAAAVTCSIKVMNAQAASDALVTRDSTRTPVGAAQADHPLVAAGRVLECRGLRHRFGDNLAVDGA